MGRYTGGGGVGSAVNINGQGGAVIGSENMVGATVDNVAGSDEFGDVVVVNAKGYHLVCGGTEIKMIARAPVDLRSKEYGVSSCPDGGEKDLNGKRGM